MQSCATIGPPVKRHSFRWRADSGTILRAYWEVCGHQANPASIQSRATIGPLDRDAMCKILQHDLS